MFGCFRRFIVLFILVFAVGYYIVDKYGDEIYINAKTSLLNIVFNDLESYQLGDQETYLKLSALAEEYFEKLGEKDFSEAYDKAGFFFNEIKNYLSDKNLSEFEFEKLNEIIKNEH